ncbi:MAG: hypothetical protein MUF36_00645 [Bacteroidales bacterium]|nr:hypothetical protein [Bacteroidales bacterium]
MIIVLGEDTAALLGLSFALAAVALSMITENPVFDAIGSIGIGALLVVISFILAVKIKSLLIGQSTDDETTAGMPVPASFIPRKILNAGHRSSEQQL